MAYLLSIVVPTKDRYFYLKHLVNLIKGFNENQIELVVQDNTDDNSEILEFIQECDYPHLKYFHTLGQIPVTENSDKAILHSTGEYVCFIGDDDGVVRNILDYVRWMKDNNVDSLRSEPPISYSWPGSEGYVFDNSAKLYYHKPKGKRVIITDYTKIRKAFLRKGGTEQLENPRIYSGIVKRTVLDDVYKNAGTYFPGPSPDMESSTALSFVVRKHVIIDDIIVLAGSCPKSTAGRGAKHQHIGKIEDCPWLPSNTKRCWEKEIPSYWTGETIYAESAIKAIRNMHQEKLLEDFNYAYFYAAFSIYHPGNFAMVKPYLNIKNILPFIFAIIEIFSIRLSTFAKNIFVKKLGLKNNIKIRENVNSINECEDIIYHDSLK